MISINKEESESTNVTRMCSNEQNEHKNTSGTYDNEGKEKTSSKSEK